VPGPALRGEGMPEELLRWRDIYSEAELYKAAVALYSKPVFDWRKGLSHSGDGKTFYDFARGGLGRMASLHCVLAEEDFSFRPGIKLDYNLNGKARSFYIYPWKERLVDLLLYRLLSGRKEFAFSPASYAYRLSGGGVDLCQRAIRGALSRVNGPAYLVKRDISNYFPSVNHSILLERLAEAVDERDYLFRLLESRVRFHYAGPLGLVKADRGVPFGTPVACFLSNVYLTPVDHDLCSMRAVRYFRYADDFLAVSGTRESAAAAADSLDAWFSRLRLSSKATHSLNVRLARNGVSSADAGNGFPAVGTVRHLGLEYCGDGNIRLSRDKFRKICNIFRRALKRAGSRLRKTKDTDRRLALAVGAAAEAVSSVRRNVAIIDYYLRHVTDDAQLRLLDRWVAEEVLSVALGRGHKKGNFRICGFGQLRSMGLPSLAHRARLIKHGIVKVPFFVRKGPAVKNLGATARPACCKTPVFSPCPEAVAG